jgi:hypothetical protein
VVDPVHLAVIALSVGRAKDFARILGAVAPWIGFARFFASHGLAGDFVGALFANGASAGFTVDLLISSLVFWIFLFESAAVRSRSRSGGSSDWGGPAPARPIGPPEARRSLMLPRSHSFSPRRWQP